MIITPHALVGAGVGAYINNLPIAFIIGFCSHFILDTIPHIDQGTLHHYEKNHQLNTRDYILAGIDGFIALVLLMLIMNYGSYNNLAIMIGALGGIMPDLISHVPLWKNKLKKNRYFAKYNEFHRKLNYQLAPKYWYWGALIQLIIIGGILYVFY